MDCAECGTELDENIDIIYVSEIVTGNFCSEDCKNQAEDGAI